MTELIREGAVKIENTHNYILKTFTITEEGLTELEKPTFINLVKGSKEENSTGVDGITSEQLLWVVHQYLTSVNQGELRNRDTSIAITHIEDALLRMEKRTQDRKFRQVKDTYKK